MALTITQNRGRYIVEGDLNTNTAQYFQRHCELIMNMHKTLRISVKFLKEVDEDGIRAIRDLYTNAIYNDCSFFIEENRSKKLYEAFPFTVAAA